MRPPLAAVVLVAWPAAAQDIDCAQAITQADLNACAAMDWEQADGELNAAYAKAVATAQDIDASLPEAERGAEAALREAQRAWIVYRDNTCKAEGYRFHGGSAEPLIVHGCLATLTRERTANLARLADEG